MQKAWSMSSLIVVIPIGFGWAHGRPKADSLPLAAMIARGWCGKEYEVRGERGITGIPAQGGEELVTCSAMPFLVLAGR